MTHLCEKIISTLPSWRKLNGPNQLMSLQQFVYDVQDQLNPLASEEDLRGIAQQLHSTGEVRAPVGQGPGVRVIAELESLPSSELKDGCELFECLEFTWEAFQSWNFISREFPDY